MANTMLTWWKRLLLWLMKPAIVTAGMWKNCPVMNSKCWLRPRLPRMAPTLILLTVCECISGIESGKRRGSLRSWRNLPRITSTSKSRQSRQDLDQGA